jgi:fermentation-respiration switch protein FrsA (DUF1100 family)
MRRDVEFDAEGVKLRGWLYLPGERGAKAPLVVMAHGFSAVKEMYLDRFAEVFAGAGIAALVFDHRGFGASDGSPRQEVDPWAQVRDYRHAITYASTLPEVDPARIGAWGSSYSGGHAIVVGAIDRRVKCVASQAMFITGSRNIRRLVRADLIAGMQAMFDADRASRFAGGAPGMIPVVSEDPLGPCALPTRDAWEWFSETGRARAPAWQNAVTLRSVEMLTEYEPGEYVARVSPTPLLMIIAAQDHVAVADEAFAAYERAPEPKELVVLQGGHFDAYTTHFATASAAASRWFVQHLRARRPPA